MNVSLLVRALIVFSLITSCQESRSGQESQTQSELQSELGAMPSAAKGPSLKGLIVNPINTGCDYGTRVVTYDEAKANLSEIKNALSTKSKQSLRLGNGASVTIRGSHISLSRKDSRLLLVILCTSSVPQGFDEELAIQKLGKELTFIGRAGEAIEKTLMNSSYFIEQVNTHRAQVEQEYRAEGRDVSIPPVRELKNLGAYFTFVMVEKGVYQFQMAISHHVYGPRSHEFYRSTYPGNYDCSFQFSASLVEVMNCKIQNGNIRWLVSRTTENNYDIKVYVNDVVGDAMVHDVAEFANQQGIIEQHRRY